MAGDHMIGLAVMNLAGETIFQALFPSAAFWDPTPSAESISRNPEVNNAARWDTSVLNPKNRIDSLHLVENPRWRIDGCTGIGTQFFTIPLFITPLVPMRIDTFIPPQSHCPEDLYEVLEFSAAFLYQDCRVSRCGIAQHILRTLELWTSQIPDFKLFYENLPFGSRIFLENISKDVSKIRVQVLPNHDLEHQLLSAASLQSIWRCCPPSFPPLVDISNLHLIRQLHDSISLVRISESQGGPQLVIFKALTTAPKHLYCELEFLLSMPAHSNIIASPLHLVTKRCRFGGKTAVVGFTSHYHPEGSLRDILPLRQVQGTLSFTDQIKWARQLTQALLHIKTEAGRSYCDLRLDNILISATDDIIMVDFEQRGLMAAFAAPEVAYLEYVDTLASDQSLSGSTREKYEKLFERYLQPYAIPPSDDYRGEKNGYYTPWLALSAAEQEAAEVYMLGRVLWCIFEGLPAPEPAIWMSYPRDADISFPEFRRTPTEVRKLIEMCTRGWRGPACGFAVNPNAIRSQDRDKWDSEAAYRDVIDRWKKELDDAERFLKLREVRRENGDDGDFFGRPKLHEVLHLLDRFSNTLDRSNSHSKTGS